MAEIILMYVTGCMLAAGIFGGSDELSSERQFILIIQSWYSVGLAIQFILKRL